MARWRWWRWHDAISPRVLNLKSAKSLPRVTSLPRVSKIKFSQARLTKESMPSMIIYILLFNAYSYRTFIRQVGSCDATPRNRAIHVFPYSHTHELPFGNLLRTFRCQFRCKIESTDAIPHLTEWSLLLSLLLYRCQ